MLDGFNGGRISTANNGGVANIAALPAHLRSARNVNEQLTALGLSRVKRGADMFQAAAYDPEGYNRGLRIMGQVLGVCALGVAGMSGNPAGCPIALGLGVMGNPFTKRLKRSVSDSIADRSLIGSYAIWTMVANHNIDVQELQSLTDEQKAEEFLKGLLSARDFINFVRNLKSEIAFLKSEIVLQLGTDASYASQFPWLVEIDHRSVDGKIVDFTGEAMGRKVVAFTNLDSKTKQEEMLDNLRGEVISYIREQVQNGTLSLSSEATYNAQRKQSALSAERSMNEVSSTGSIIPGVAIVASCLVGALPVGLAVAYGYKWYTSNRKAEKLLPKESCFDDVPGVVYQPTVHQHTKESVQLL